jgi:hypothetical protein
MIDPAPVRHFPGAVLAAALLGVPAALGFFGSAMCGNGLLLLFFAVGIPFCLGYFCRQHWWIAALTYAGSVATSAAAFGLVIQGWRTEIWLKLPMVFSGLFLIAAVPSIVGA